MIQMQNFNSHSFQTATCRSLVTCIIIFHGQLLRKKCNEYTCFPMQHVSINENILVYRSYTWPTWRTNLSFYSQPVNDIHWKNNIKGFRCQILFLFTFFFKKKPTVWNILNLEIMLIFEGRDNIFSCIIIFECFDPYIVTWLNSMNNNL